ncbi:MFS transporter [Rhodococcus marinonascens]|uniref:MFS transporter n=1 Tax=Rhodococcus marinonascens TaxID=38311 RepID=UPI000932AA77|nr:MFS transporter [Rhodococcus marinonascens]
MRVAQKDGAATVLRDPVFVRLALIQALNMIGDGLIAAGVPMLLVSRQSGGSDIAAFVAASGVGGLVVLAAATLLLDAVSRRSILIVSDISRVSVVGLVAIYLSTDGLVALIAAGVIAGAGIGVFRPAYSTYIGEVVDPHLRRPANALRSLSSKVAAIIAPGLISVVALTGAIENVLPIAAVIAVTSIFVLLTCPPSMSRGEAVRDPSGIFDGLRTVTRTPWILAVMCQGAVQVGLVMAPFAVLVPIWLEARSAEAQYGFLLAAEAAGAIGGAILALRVKTTRVGAVAILALLLQGLVLASLIVNGPMWVAYVGFCAAGVGLAVFGVLWITALQERIPRQTLGRVMSVDALASAALAPLGAVLGGVAASNNRCR